MEGQEVDKSGLKADVMERLQGIFRDIFDDDKLCLSPGTTASDIAGWDSLNQVKIILACERAFSIRLRPREINGVENVDEMVDHLVKAITKER